MKTALFCHNALGDGIVALVLAHNLYLNGFQVDTYQNTVGALQSWFPHLPIIPYPEISEIESLLQKYELIFVFQNTASLFVQQLISQGKKTCPERIKVVYIYPSKNIINEPYYQDTQIDPTRPIAENLRLICERILHLPNTVLSNGIVPPSHLIHRRYPNRVLLHPTGSRPGKNWPKEKYALLAEALEKEGYEIAWVLNNQESEEWQNIQGAKINHSLDALARSLYESGFFIGNDSGPGHLASSLGIPTITIARRKAYCAFSAPGFTKGAVVTPSSWIPNIRGFRLRDRQWKRFISVKKVLKTFRRIQQLSLL